MVLLGFIGCFPVRGRLGIVKFPLHFPGFANDTAWFPSHSCRRYRDPFVRAGAAFPYTIMRHVASPILRDLLGES